jgi:hypothetical protein
VPLAVVAALIPLLVIGPIVLAMRLPPNVRVDVAGNALTVVFGGVDVLWTLRRRLTVPVGQVRGVAAAPLALVPREGMRLPGASVPGVIRAGSYGVGTSRDLWDVRRPELVLWIEFEPGAPYRRLILQVPDADAAAVRLAPILGSFVPASVV